MRHARKPARVAEEDSETPYMTGRAMEFMAEAGDRPWCLHLSYIKPHWPYIAPAPYNALYGPEHVLPAVRSEAERRDPHPVYREFMDQRVSRTFSRDEVRAEVIPVYMGLIRQIDDQLGLLFRFMEERGLLADTLIVFTSDHGDYLGDHWLGEKDLFHDPSVKVPLIICDPSPQADSGPRHGVRRAGRGHRPGANLPRRPGGRLGVARRTAWRGARCCRSCTGRRRPNGGAMPSARTTTRSCPWRPSSGWSRAMRGSS